MDFVRRADTYPVAVQLIWWANEAMTPNRSSL
jgi:hypothetical protein